MKNYRVMFVCLANICRSPLAHAVFARLVDDAGLSDKIAIESSGTGAWHVGQQADSRMRKTAKDHGVFLDHRARQLQASDLVEYNLILTMDSDNYANALALASSDEERGKVHLFREYDTQGPGSVPDPYYGGAESFEEVWDIVYRTCQALLKDIRRNLNI